MADLLYPSFKQLLLGGDIDLVTDDIRVVLMKDTYSYNSAHDFMNDVSTHENGRSIALSGKTITNGVFDANDITLNATSASACNAIIIFKHTGSDATASLIAYIDFSTFTPLASQLISASWNASGIFTI